MEYTPPFPITKATTIICHKCLGIIVVFLFTFVCQTFTTARITLDYL